MEEIITREFLLNNPNSIFVFGDNLLRKGFGGAAKLRSLNNTYGFITKKYPNNSETSFFNPEEYRQIYRNEITALRNEIINNPDKEYLISKLGGGLANRFKIFEQIIEPVIKADLYDLKNVRFLW